MVFLGCASFDAWRTLASVENSTRDEANTPGTNHQNGIKLTGLAIASLMLLTAQFTSAQPIAYEGFDIPTGPKALSGGAGETSFGWAPGTTWGPNNHGINQGSLSYTDRDGASLPTIGNSVSIASSFSAPGGLRSLAATYESGTIWISFIGLVNNPGSANTFAGISLVDHGAEQVFLGDMNSFSQWGIGNSSGNFNTTTSSSDQRFIVVRVDFDMGRNPGNERIAMWLNPSLNKEPLLSEADAFADNIVNFRLTQIRIQGGNTGGSTFDELRLGYTYSDVVGGRSERLAIAYEGFDMPTGPNGLRGSAGETSFGWAAGSDWGTNNHGITPSSLAYTDADGTTLPSVGGSVSIASAFAPPGALRTLASRFDSGTIWISFIGQVANPGAPNTFAGISLVDHGIEKVFLGDMNSYSHWGIGNVSGAFETRTASSEQEFVLVRVDFNAGLTPENERVTMWLNPSLTQQPDLAHADAVANNIANFGFDQIRIQGGNTGGSTFDELRIGRTFLDVVEAARPRLAIRCSQTELCWQTARNTYYQLQYRSLLTHDQWIPLTENWIQGDGHTYCVTDSIHADQPQRFYQIVTSTKPPRN